MAYWILKTEPETYSFQDLIRDKETSWTGVRNFQARNNLRAMKRGDVAIIYESGGPKSAVGVAKISKEAYQELKNDKNWSAVDIVPVKRLKNPVPLAQMKDDSVLSEMKLVRQSRLSVCPMTEKEFDRLIALSGS